MLIRFRVANHRSLRKEQELSFTTALSTNDGIEVPEVGIPILRVMSIHGANGSGKSNLLHAFGFASSAVLHSHRMWSPDGGTPALPFAFANDPKPPSVFEFDFMADNTRWIYGFELNRERVLAEWLFQFGPTRRRRMLFERNEQKFEFGTSFPGLNQTIATLTRTNSLFLSAAAQNSHKGVDAVWNWFSNISHAGPEDFSQRIRYTTDRLQDPHTRIMVTDAMRAADFGLTGLELVEKDIPEDTKRFMELVAREMKRTPERVDKIKEVRFQHQGGDQGGFLDFSEESHGTQAWFAMLGPLLSVLERGALLCFDELDNHLHSLLVKQVVRAFKDAEVNRKNAQLLFTTQRTFDLRRSAASDSELGSILNRDEVWLTEKDDKGQTRLYPVSDYKPRQREDLERAYLAGSFGAIPYADVRGALIKALWSTDGQPKQVRTR